MNETEDRQSMEQSEIDIALGSRVCPPLDKGTVGTEEYCKSGTVLGKYQVPLGLQKVALAAFENRGTKCEV